MRTHIQILGWTYIVIGAFELLGAILVFGIFGLAAGFGALGGSPIAFYLSSTIGAVIGGLIAITALPELIAGWGLLRQRSWARILAIILGVLNLFKFPYGTVLGVYTLWALLQDEAKPLFD